MADHAQGIGRRAVRAGTGTDPVEPEVLAECLRIAQQAPAAGALLAGFRWLVIREPELKAKIAGPMALRSRGLGSSLVNYHLGGPAERQVAELLGIPEGVTQVCLVAIGYATTQDFRPGARPALEEITYQDRWGRLGGVLRAGRTRS